MKKEVFDLQSQKMRWLLPSQLRPFSDWREHKYELLYTPFYELLKWELHVNLELKKQISHSFHVPPRHIEMSSKEWMYKN